MRSGVFAAAKQDADYINNLQIENVESQMNHFDKIIY